MNNLTMMNIGAVERDTGLGKDTLRVWERRYNFPQPIRDANGERLYPTDQVERLRVIKRLMDLGHRPGRLFSASEEDLLLLSGSGSSTDRAITTDDQEGICQILDLIKAHDAQRLRQALNQAMMRQGLQRFILGTVVALNRLVGEAWMRGELQVYEEHLYSEQMKSLLRQTIGNLPTSPESKPRILLTTVPEERHVLGLLMVEGLLTLDGATCISLGTQTPLLDIRQAAEAHGVDIVALSFSSAFSTRQIAPLLTQLREMLPKSVQLWAGGAATEKLPAIDGVKTMLTLEEALLALHSTKSAHQVENNTQRSDHIKP